MAPILFASYGYAWASGAAFLIGLFAAFMSTGKSENELWRRFSILSFINTVFCITGLIQNYVSSPDALYRAAQANLAAGMLLGPAFLDFVPCVAARQDRTPSALAWAAAIGWVVVTYAVPQLLITREVHFAQMPLHYYRHAPSFYAFQATLFGIIVYALVELGVKGWKTRKSGIHRFVFPSCILWAGCGFWDTAISEWVQIAMPLSWLGGVTVNVAFLGLVTQRSQEAFRIQEKHRSVMKDVGHAREIQMVLIRHDFPQFPGIRIVGEYLPMEELGGDFYEVRRLDENKIYVFISDVTGHGIASAFITAMMKISLDGLSLETLYSPKKVLTHLNDSLLEKIMDRFITGAYGILDQSNMTFAFCSAGHHPPILHFRAADQTVIELETRGRLLGAFDDLEAEEQIVHLGPGDRLLLVTDGTYESFSTRGEMFGLARLKSIFASSVVNSLDPLFLELHRFASGSRQADDMAGILITVQDAISSSHPEAAVHPISAGVSSIP